MENEIRQPKYTQNELAIYEGRAVKIASVKYTDEIEAEATGATFTGEYVLGTGETVSEERLAGRPSTDFVLRLQSQRDSANASYDVVVKNLAGISAAIGQLVLMALENEDVREAVGKIARDHVDVDALADEVFDHRNFNDAVEDVVRDMDFEVDADISVRAR